MPSVTVAGASGKTVTLFYDSSANASIASTLAKQITKGVASGKILPSADSAPPLPAGKIGEFDKETSGGVTRLPTGYKAVVDNAASAIILGSGDAGESVLAGAGNLTFEAFAGSGTIVAGGGNDFIAITRADKGAWDINLGNGKNTVVASGSGADSISLGSGPSTIYLGAGTAKVTVGGADTITAGSGASTITGTPSASVYLVAGKGDLDFIGGNGGNTVIAGTGSETLFAGSGADLLQGGSAGHNLLQAGSGADTLVGSTKHQGTDVFQFAASAGGGTDLVVGFTGADKIHLVGYGPNEVSNAIATQVHSAGSTTITLSDSTKITFQSVADLTKSNFS